MNEIKLSLYVMNNGETLIVDGIDFKSAAFIKIDFKPTQKNIKDDLDDSLLVFSELLKSLDKDGSYLIFTSASGIADDGGWSGVRVEHKNDSILWEFFAGENFYKIELEKKTYIEQINRINREIALLPKNILLEPSQVFYPEEWEFK